MRLSDTKEILLLIVIANLFFIAGAISKSNDYSSFWKFLLDFASLIASIFTSIGVIGALYAYQTWKKQITSPEIYEKDKAIVERADKLYRDVYMFSMSEYEELCAYLSMRADGELDDSDFFESLNRIKEIRRKFDSKLRLELYHSIGDINSLAVHSFGTYGDIPNELKDFLSSVRIYIRLMSLCLAHSQGKNISFPTITDKEIKYTDLQENGKNFEEIGKRLNVLRNFYKEKWGI